MAEPSRSRPFGFWTAGALVVGTMIGSGIFVLPAQLAPFGWSGVAAWICASIGAMLIARVLVDLTHAMPGETGTVAICGRVLGPATGVLIGWSYWVATWCGNAVVATTVAHYLSVFWPLLGSTPLRMALSGSVVIALLTWVNLLGMRDVGRLQVLTTALKLLPLLVVLVLLACLASSGNARSTGSEAAPFAVGRLTPALGLTFYAMLGFESAALLTDRVRDPVRNVLWATLAGLGATALLYLALTAGMMILLPTGALAASPTPIAWFVGLMLGHKAALGVAAFAAISGLGYLNGAILFLGELPLGAVRGGLLPGRFARTNRKDVAYAPLLIGSGLTIMLLLLSSNRSGNDVLNFLMLVTTASSIWLYIAVCVAALIMRRKPVLAAMGLAFCGWVLAATGAEAGGWGIALTAAGLPLYLIARARFRSPTPRPA